MGAVGPWQIVLVVILALLLFGGRGRISAIMGDFAKGIKSFRKGMEDEDKAIAAEDEEKKSAASLKTEDIEDVKVEETTKASS